MHVISRKKLRDFWERHSHSRHALEAWFKILRRSRYDTLHKLRATFPSADPVGPYVVFNVSGNKYRVIVVIHFNRGKVYIRDVLTHEEYDKGTWKHG